MAVKRRTTRRVTRRKAAKVPRAAKRSARRATRKAARKAKTPKAPKRRRASRKASKRVAKRKARTPRKPKMKVGTMRRVWSGTADKTTGGLTKKDLCLNKRGKVVSKKKLKSSTKNFKNSALSKWTAACMKARKELGLTGFVACKKGTTYYKLAKKYYQ